MKKQVLTLLMASLLTGTAFAAPGTVTEKTQVLESTVYGAPQDGAVVDRINQLDETVYGNGFSGNTATLSKRVDSLYDSVEGSGTNISLREEMDALEYTYQNSINDGSLVERVEKMERSVNGRISTGSLQKRIISLKTKVYGSNVTLTNQVGTLSSDHVFKVTLNDAVSTKTSHEGDTIKFTVAENVMDGNVLLVPAGTVGSATITSLKKARSFGRNGALDITFDSVPAIDGTEFTAVQGNEAKEKTKGEIKAAGASVIGGDGLAHSDDELAEAVTVPTANDDSVDSTVDEADDSTVNTDEEDTNTADSEEVEDTNDTAENVSQPIVVVKRNQ